MKKIEHAHRTFPGSLIIKFGNTSFKSTFHWLISLIFKYLFITERSQLFKNSMHNITSRHIPRQDLYGFSKGQSVKPKQFTSSWTFFTSVKNWMLIVTILKVCFDTFPEFAFNHKRGQDWTVHLVVLELFLFVSWLSGYVEKRCDKKAIIIILKFMMPPAEQLIFTIHILPNISKSKDNHWMNLVYL